MQVIRDYMENWGLCIPEVASLQGPALQGFQETALAPQVHFHEAQMFSQALEWGYDTRNLGKIQSAEKCAPPQNPALGCSVV